MRKSTVLILGLTIMLLIVFLSNTVDNTAWTQASNVPSATLNFTIGNKLVKKDINCFKNESDGRYYVFLPSFDLQTVIPLFTSARYVEMCGTYYRSGEALSDYDTGIPIKIAFYDSRYNVIENCEIVFLQSSNLPTLYITSSSGNMDSINSDKNRKEAGTMTLVTAAGQVAYDGKIDAIKGRGNYTWTRAKKPYNIKLNIAADLLGMGASKNWILLANYADGTHIRNKMVFDFAREAGMVNAPESEFVDLYLNGYYAGVYQLTETIEIGKNRIDIHDLKRSTQSLNSQALASYKCEVAELDAFRKIRGYDLPSQPKDSTGGYLLEMEYGARFRKEESAGFVSGTDTNVIIKSPDFASTEQVAYISDYYEEFEQAVIQADGINPETGKHYSEYIDLDSWALAYIIEEVFLRNDAGYSSQFFYKDSDANDPKMYAGPPWDFDISIGNSTSQGLRLSDNLYVRTRKVFSYLTKHQDFADKVTAEYGRVEPLLNKLLASGIDGYEAQLSDAVTMDAIRWGVKDVQGVLVFGDLNANTAYMKEFFGTRLKALSNAWLSGSESCYVTIEYSKYSRVCLSVKRGERLSRLPEWTEEGMTFNGLFYNETGDPFNQDAPIVGNITLTAKWNPTDQA